MKRNFCQAYKNKVEAIHQQLTQDMVIISKQLAVKFRDEAAMRTPVDMGDLRAKWAIMPVNKIKNEYIISITNPAEYAAYVEFGYMQRPGMILKMKEERGKLRFLNFLGYSQKYKMGDPTGKAKPDEEGNVVIVTRKRFIKGRFMARGALEEMKTKHWPGAKKYLLAKMKATWETVK